MKQRDQSHDTTNVEEKIVLLEIKGWNYVCSQMASSVWWADCEHRIEQFEFNTDMRK